MPGYKHILIAVDLTGDSHTVAAKSMELARQWGATVQLLHVVEFVPIEPMSDAMVPVIQVDEQAMTRAHQQIKALAHSVGLPADHCRVTSGNVKAEVLRHARESGADLIVLGSRERHGLSILVNLTEDTVLHGAPCDLLAIRVR